MFFEDTRVAGVTRPYLVEHPDWRMRIPEPLKRCAVFLGVNRIPGVEATAHFAGTGFLVAVVQEGEPFAYIVTAKHVVRDMNEYTKKAPGASFVRLNDYSGNAFQTSLLGTTWITSPDDMVDLAICPIEFPNQGLSVIPTTTFVQKSQFTEFGIGVGDDVFSVGLLSFVVSEKTNVTVVRYGTIAMLPEEPIQTKRGPREVFLIEARSLGGLSGSPVFVRETLWLSPETIYRRGDVVPEKLPPMLAGGRTFLLGVMHGHWDIDPDTIGSIYMKASKGAGVNSGIALVTPAAKILELLNGPVLTAERAEQVKERRAKKQAGTAPEVPLGSALAENAAIPFDPAVPTILPTPKDAIAKPGAKKSSKRKR